MTPVQWDSDQEEAGAGFTEKAMTEAMRATLRPQSLLGDLPAELTLGMRLRRELAEPGHPI